MVGEERAKEIADFVIDSSGADQTEVLVMGVHSELTRFAESVIHQNMSEDNSAVFITAMVGDRAGRASTNQTDRGSLEATRRRAMEAAKRSPAGPAAGTLASPAPYPQLDIYDEETALYSPAGRARLAATVVEIARRQSFGASGACSTSVEEMLVANSKGVNAYARSTSASLSTVISSGSGYGYADAVSRRVRDVDAGWVARAATEKCLRCSLPIALESGVYEVVLEPKAVSTLVSFFGMLGFGARSCLEGRSFVAGNLGKRIVGPNVSIWDDGLDTRGLAFPFDFQGVPKRRVDLVADGVAAGIVYDLETALEAGAQSTGHALPPEARQYTSDPIPANLIMAPGEATVEDMIGSVKRGLVVTRFHYTNVVHQLKAVVTGMTRDGTFLVENGTVVGAVKNLRFTQSILEALQHVEMIGREQRLETEDFFGASYVPALKIGRFNFTGTTEH